jgi:hypothetical protein
LQTGYKKETMDKTINKEEFSKEKVPDYEKIAIKIFSV